MRCIDYKLKADVLNTPLPKLINYLDYLTYVNNLIGVVRDFDVENGYYHLYEKYGHKYINEARRINNATYKRINRLGDRIESYLTMGNCIFITLTFSDSTLSCTSVDTRRQYVRKYLKSQCQHFVANIDFGGKKGREHYHALVVADRVDLSWWHQHCGKTYCEMVKALDQSQIKLAKYVAKLTNHAIKETTKRQCYIYSR